MLRTGVVRIKSTMAKWGFHNGPAVCKGGSSEDTAEHLLICPLLSQVCTTLDLVRIQQRSITDSGTLEVLCVGSRSSSVIGKA